MTTAAVVYAFLFIHLGVILVATAYFVLGASIAPELTERARERFARRPWLPLLVGLTVSVPWVIGSLILLNTASAQLKFVGAVLGSLWILASLLGGAGVARQVGQGGGGPAWRQAARGGLIISLTWALPLVGWFGVLPLTLAAGTGCLLTGLVPNRRASVTTPPAVAMS